MAESQLTIAVLAGLAVEQLRPGLSAAERQKLVATLRDKAREIPMLKPFDLGERLLGVITDALRKPLAGVLEEVWKQRKEMRDAAAKTSLGHGSTADVELFEHTITWAVHPTVKITVNKVSKTLKFDVEVKLALQAAKIVIERAHITRFLTGTLESTVNLKYGEFPLMAPLKRTIDLPGELVLPSGGIDLGGGRGGAVLPDTRAQTLRSHHRIAVFAGPGLFEFGHVRHRSVRPPLLGRMRIRFEIL